MVVNSTVTVGLIRLEPIMLKILPIIPSRISQKILPLFFFIPVSNLLFP